MSQISSLASLSVPLRLNDHTVAARLAPAPHRADCPQTAIFRPTRTPVLRAGAPHQLGQRPLITPDGPCRTADADAGEQYFVRGRGNPSDKDGPAETRSPAAVGAQHRLRADRFSRSKASAPKDLRVRRSLCVSAPRHLRQLAVCLRAPLLRVWYPVGLRVVVSLCVSVRIRRRDRASQLTC
jgi:hypothetical protein